MTADLKGALVKTCAVWIRELSDGGEAPLKMEKMVCCEAAPQRGDLGAASGCCKQLKLRTVVSVRKGDAESKTLISAGAKNRRKGEKKNQATGRGRKRSKKC